MPRKKIDREQEDSMKRIREAIEDPQFAIDIDDLLKAAKKRSEESIFGSRYQEYDEARGWYIQYGLYYQLRDLCDKYDLFWSHDWPYVEQLLTLIRKQRQPTEPEKATALLECPPRTHWQWWRMAQTGLGFVREDEIQIIGHARPDGLTQKDIAKGIEAVKIKGGIDERTVKRAIDQCWEYATQSGIALNVRQIADLAGLDDAEGLDILFFARWRYEWQKIRKAKHMKGRPDK